MSTIQRRNCNQIIRLKTDDASWIEGEEEINAHITEYFKNLFRTLGDRDWSDMLDVVQVKVTEAMNEALLKPILDMEVYEAAKELGALKAPGSDGFPDIFFQKFWHVVGTDIIKVVNEGSERYKCCSYP